MYIRYTILAVFVLLAKAATFIFGPIAALFPVWLEESETTGYPSKYPGKLRMFLRAWLRWMQTFDDCLDAYWHSGKADWIRDKGYDQNYYDTYVWLRWFCAVLWLWRNPAYGAALLAGIDQTGIKYKRDDDPADLIWDGDSPCRLWRKFTNEKGQTGFLYRARFFYTSKRYLEVVLGYKAPWYQEIKAPLAIRVTPFRSVRSQ